MLQDATGHDLAPTGYEPLEEVPPDAAGRSLDSRQVRRGEFDIIFAPEQASLPGDIASFLTEERQTVLRARPSQPCKPCWPRIHFNSRAPT